MRDAKELSWIRGDGLEHRAKTTGPFACDHTTNCELHLCRREPRSNIIFVRERAPRSPAATEMTHSLRASAAAARTSSPASTGLVMCFWRPAAFASWPS